MNYGKQRVKTPQQFTKELIDNSIGILSKVGLPTKGFHGRNDEVSAVMECLLKKRMRNCVIVGNAGVGKTEIAKQAIRKLNKNEHFLNLDVGFLQSGCTLVGQFEQRMKNIVEPIAQYNALGEDKVSLFIDEIHALWMVNRSQVNGTVAASDMLKPYLSSGQITIIGTTTYDEYKKYIMTDIALLRRISPIFVSPMGDEETLRIVKSFAGNELSENVARLCVEKSHGIDFLSNPDCSLEIADRVMAKALINGRIAKEDDVDAVVKLMNVGGMPR